MTSFTLRKDEEFLKNLHCSCGKPATIAWHLPVRAAGPKKISKTEEKEQLKPQVYPYGWSCDDHVPSLTTVVAQVK